MDVQAGAEEIVKKLNQAGYLAYFAGGWVRDYLMGHPSDDIDIATNAPPEKILDLFPRTILVGLAFGVVVVIAHGHQFEVATFRRDVHYTDGRKPAKIELSTPEEDASRRDFTINGMFYDPVEGVVHDFVQGAQDIKRGIIRCIGNPYERFVEDRLRMLRAVRFSARFGFTIDPETQEAIAANADTLFPPVAMERVCQEFIKMAKWPRFDAALIEMHRLKLLPEIFSRLKEVHLHDIKEAVSGFKNFPPGTEAILYLMELFPSATALEAEELCRYLRTSNADSSLAVFLVSLREHVASEHELALVDLYAWAHLYANPHAEVCLQVIAAKMPLEPRKNFLAMHRHRMELLKMPIDRIIKKQPIINASILQAQGLNPGKLMGMLIKEAERLAILNGLDGADEVLKLLKSSHMWPKEAS